MPVKSAICYFNPRSPHGERHAPSPDPNNYKQFQPTLPARGATAACKGGASPSPISTHAPRTGSDHINMLLQGICKISTHAPRTGSDQAGNVPVQSGEDFNPRSPHGERRFRRSCTRRQLRISTHAPRTGSDIAVAALMIAVNGISTHAPRTGSDSIARFLRVINRLFQPTLPARGATVVVLVDNGLPVISTHAPRTGSDIHGKNLPTSVCISTHAPRTGSDVFS